VPDLPPAMPEDSVAHLLRDWSRERPDLDTWPIAIFARILRLSARLQQMSADWLTAEGLTWEAFSLIVTLRRQGAPHELRPTDMMRESLLTSGAVTNRIDRVVALGLVERRPDPADRRGVVVCLTPAGIARADSAIRAHADHLAHVLADLPTEDRDALSTLLARALHLAETHADP
jgi:DNA-binding MarR family transcriptional regulator